MKKAEPISIGSIGNYYGGLTIKKMKGSYYWSIENWDGEDWEKISTELYFELIKHENSIRTNKTTT